MSYFENLMSTKKAIIRISRGNSLPLTLRMVFSLILFLIYIALTGYLPKALVIALMILLAPTLPLIWTLQDIIEINMNKKSIHEYIWVLGSKWGTPKLFEHLEYIFINETKMSQKMSSWGGHAHHHKYLDYIAYLKLSSGKNQLIARSKNHTSLINKIRKLSIRLNIPIKDTDRL